MSAKSERAAREARKPLWNDRAWRRLVNDYNRKSSAAESALFKKNMYRETHRHTKSDQALFDILSGKVNKRRSAKKRTTTTKNRR